MSCSSRCACDPISELRRDTGVDAEVGSDLPTWTMDDTATYSARFRERIRRLHAKGNGDVSIEQVLAQWGEIVRVFGMEVAEQQLSAMERDAGNTS
jgi:hypothetical protein